MSILPANHQENMRRTGNIHGIDPNTGKHWSMGLGLAKAPSGQVGLGEMGRQPQPQKAPRILSQLKQQNQVPDSYYEGTGFQNRMSRAGQLMGVGGGQFGQMGMLSAPPNSSRFSNVTPERMQKAEEERRRYLERNNGVDKHNLADDIYNFMATQPGDQGHMTTGLPQPSIQPIRDRRARMDIHLVPPARSGGMENLSGSLGGQRPNPYSAPQIPQMGGGYGGGQGMQQFMQFMQTMMQMFQQLQGGGMGGGFQGQMRRPQTYGRSPYGGY